jgi:hypothetical protein
MDEQPRAVVSKADAQNVLWLALFLTLDAITIGYVFKWPAQSASFAHAERFCDGTRGGTEEKQK